MLSLRTQVQAVNFLQILIQGEDQVERARQHLAKLPTFEPYQAFRQLDQSASGRLSPADLQAFMSRYNCLISTSDSFLLATSLSPDAASVNYNDFLAAVLPWTNDYLRRLAIDQKPQAPLAKDAEYAVCLVLEKELDIAQRAVDGSRQLQTNADFTVLDWFRSMDLDADGAVTEGDLKQFCARVGVYVREVDVRTAFQRLDKDRDGVLTLCDLQKSFTPLSESVSRSGSALLDTRAISPLRSSARSGSPLLLSARRSEHRERDTSPRPIRKQRFEQPTPSQSAETIAKSDFFTGKPGSEDLEVVTRAVLTYFRALLTLNSDQAALKSMYFGRFGAIWDLFASSASQVSIPDFEKACRRLGVRVTLDEVSALFERFDEDRDERLSEKDLRLMLFGGLDTPRREEGNGTAGDSLLEKVVCGLIDVEKARKRVFSAKLSDLYSAFRTLDTDQDGFLTRRDVQPRVLDSRDHREKFSFFDFLADITPSPLFRPVLL